MLLQIGANFVTRPNFTISCTVKAYNEVSPRSIEALEAVV